MLRISFRHCFPVFLSRQASSFSLVTNNVCLILGHILESGCRAVRIASNLIKIMLVPSVRYALAELYILRYYPCRDIPLP